jgi:hypothetical protein
VSGGGVVYADAEIAFAGEVIHKFAFRGLPAAAT